MKKIICLVISLILIIGMCGCANNESISNKSKTIQNIEIYLNEKYSVEFIYVGDGNDVWSSKSKSYLFEDKSSRQLIVKDTDGYFTDNYGSSLYDVVASESFSQELNMDSKISINTESVFLGSGKNFNGYKDYLCACPVINVAMYVVGDCDWYSSAEKLKYLLKDCTVSAIVYSVDANTYNSLENFDATSDVLSSASFWIENNMVSEKSWEG